ncbi:MAG: AraC family transcriptional regulator [Defluviitaleaceae bacterium]|nr:AraC family transcriptional regulator [Defluviitaleaceae bacterium]
MDWFKGMNRVVEHIEENLTKPIPYESLSRIVGCSVYEFSRIFSFMAGMSISEYIRRRRLSQAVFDIQNGSEKIIDISLKYCYESQAAFARAFKEMHGATPLSARKMSIPLKTYPPITFVLTIKGVNEMDFRLEKKDSFKIVGWKCDGGYDKWCEFDKTGVPQLQAAELIKPPFWYVGASFLNRENNESVIIGAQLDGPNLPKDMDVETIPSAVWAVFTFGFRPGEDAAGETYARVVTEWLPQSNYSRNESVPYLEVYGHIENCFEIWVPVNSK